MFKWSKFSESLLVRSVYLITIPIVLVQIIGIVIFFELHWDLVLKRSAQSISNEIKILELQKDSPSIDNYANTLQIIRTDNLDISEASEIKNWIFKKFDSYAFTIIRSFCNFNELIFCTNQSLIDNFRYDSCANCSTPFSNCKSHTLLNSNGINKFRGHFDSITRHYHI